MKREPPPFPWLPLVILVAFLSFVAGVVVRGAWG